MLTFAAWKNRLSFVHPVGFTRLEGFLENRNGARTRAARETREAGTSLLGQYPLLLGAKKGAEKTSECFVGFFWAFLQRF